MMTNNPIGIKWLKTLYGLLIFRCATAPLLILSAWGNLKYINSLSTTDTKDLQTVTELFIVLTVVRALVQLPAVIMKNSEKGYSLLIASLITEIVYYGILTILGGGMAIADDVRLLITVAYAIPSFFYIHKRKFLYSDDGKKTSACSPRVPTHRQRSHRPIRKISRFPCQSRRPMLCPRRRQ